jgi:glutathione S-transferase
MGIKLYDLAGASDDCRFSPYCWNIKMALRHKGLEAEEIPCRFTEKDKIAFSGQKLVPILVDGDRVIPDSWEIARYLESTYSNSPSLFGGAVGEAEALFIKFWCEGTIYPLVARIIALDLVEHIHEMDKAYFIETREKIVGMTLGEFAQPTPEGIANLSQALNPVRKTLERQPYLGGTQPNYADYVLFGAFQWARAVSPISLLTPEDPVYTWREQLLNAFNSYGRNTFGYPV